MEKVKAAKLRLSTISAEEVKELAGRSDVLIVDVRDEHEIARGGKIEGALHVSRGTLEFKADKASPLFNDDFEDAETIIVYCATGARAALCGAALLDLGYKDVRTLETFNAWTEIDGPVDT
ncbi:rhodanese-like domain-containing protein [Thalassospiraceae bacterium LMO-JJ14]|nr:rhodanese-like domain-containing protein [Thalassospiraceae bacterium LMO-JJ14]